MLDWKNRRKNTKPKVSLKVLSKGGSNDDGESTNAPRVKKPTPSSSNATMKPTRKKVGPLDVLCRENLVKFVTERRANKSKQRVIEDHFKK